MKDPLEFKTQSELLDTKGYKRVRQKPMEGCVKCRGTGVRRTNRRGKKIYCDCMNRLNK